MRQLTSLDAQFLAMESPTTYGHVSGLAIYDPSTAPGGSFGRADICRLVSQRIHLLPPFRWKLAEVPFGLDHPYWVEDEHFDLDFHIRDTAVPPPGGDRQLADLVARIVARPLDRAHPLWELYVVHGIEGDRIGLLTKVHHAAVDGVSGAEILGVLLDLEPGGRAVEPPGDEPGERAPTQLEMLGRGALGLPRQPLRALRALPRTLPSLDSIPGVRPLPGVGLAARAVSGVARRVTSQPDGGILARPEARPPRTRFNGRISPHRRYAFGEISLDRVKAIKNALGVTVNDAVVAVCAGALRSWLLERDELPAEPLIALVPVSVRTQEELGTFGNRVSGMLVPIPTDVADARGRLLVAHEILADAKERHAAVPATLLQDATQFIPPAIAARAARVTTQITASRRLRPLLNLTISNVPGPRVPLYCAGARLEANYPVSVITDGVGLNITCMSYLDRIDFGIVADRDQVDDAWTLMEALEREVEEVEETVCGASEGAPTA